MTSQQQPPRRTPPTSTREAGTLTPGERLRVAIPAKGWAEVDPEFVRVFGDTGEEVAAIPFEERCRCHHWFVAGDGAQWQATEIASWDTRRKPDKGERFVIVTAAGGQSEFITRYAATRGDLAKHLAELGRAAHDVAHPRDGAHEYSRSVPLLLDWLRTVDDVLAHLEAKGLRPVRVGTRLALAHPIASPSMGNSGPQFHMRPGDPERELVRDWAPLIVARLEGPHVGCDVDACERAADVALMGSAFVCAGHADAAVGEAAAKPARTGIVGAIASAIGA